MCVWCVFSALSTQTCAVNMWKSEMYMCMYLKAEPEAWSLHPSCPLCPMMGTGSLDILGTGSCWTGSLSQCKQASHRNKQHDSETETQAAWLTYNCWCLRFKACPVELTHCLSCWLGHSRRKARSSYSSCGVWEPQCHLYGCWPDQLFTVGCIHTRDQTHERFRRYIFITPRAFPAGLTCDPGALVGMCQLPHVCRRWQRQLCRLDLQRVLLQVFLDDIQVHVGTRRGRRAGPGPPVRVQPDLSHIRHLTDTEQDGFSVTAAFLQQWGSTMALILEVHGFFLRRLPISIMSRSSSPSFYGTRVCCVCGNELRWCCLS